MANWGHLGGSLVKHPTLDFHPGCDLSRETEPRVGPCAGHPSPSEPHPHPLNKVIQPDSQEASF